MDRLVNLLSDALAVAVGDLVEARADLVNADIACDAAENKAAELRDECARLKTQRAELIQTDSEFTRLACDIRDTRHFDSAPTQDRQREKLAHDKAVEALLQWLQAKLDKEIPF